MVGTRARGRHHSLLSTSHAVDGTAFGVPTREGGGRSLRPVRAREGGTRHRSLGCPRADTITPLVHHTRANEMDIPQTRTLRRRPGAGRSGRSRARR